jgi:hypothetical protein
VQSITSRSKELLLNGVSTVSDRKQRVVFVKENNSIYFESNNVTSSRMTVELALGSKVSRLQWLNI